MSLSIEKIILPSAHFNGESSLPAFSEMKNVQNLTQSCLDEDDGLFVGYGFLSSLFPYRMQDLYDRAEEPTAYTGIVLENKYLKAVFIPELGGRMWSLFDKTAKRDLLYSNSIVRPCNLAVRNAWLAGGIEFNCGMVGHHPYTCSPIFACETKLDDGTPVLRMYEYERIRGCVYQMDFFLPEDSRLLFARMRIVNPNRETVPMYWWTNMAVREDKNARNVIDADETYNNKDGIVGKNPVPYYGGIDITYPSNNPVAIDYFWKIPDDSRKFTAYLNKEGYGFVQTSTKRLQGRKLFVWGQGEGGARWQEFLTRDGSDGRYVEIQAGLAHTQYECLPMPPLTAWEWLEGYGAIQADSEKVHGEWADCRKEVKARLNDLCSEKYFEDKLAETKPMALRPAERMIRCGSGWGGLENLRRKKMGEPVLCPHLDFGSLQQPQKIWIQLLETNSLASKECPGSMMPPDSWMFQKEWTELILQSNDCHEKYLHLSAIEFASKLWKESKVSIEKALSLRKTPTALYLFAQIKRITGDISGAADTILEALSMLSDDISLTREAFNAALSAKKYEAIIDSYSLANEKIKLDGRISMYYAFSLLRTGRVEEAEDILLRNGGLSVTDIREGEVSLTDLYLMIAEAKDPSGDFKPADVEIPRRFDFRMNVPRREKESARS